MIVFVKNFKMNYKIHSHIKNKKIITIVLSDLTIYNY
jgi:hypothetical protein